ncbi:TRAP transporter substrate-binding protein [uncultured Dysosmobacter sp.]|uniref:TRAP transporter substrate-binding protein n=1 Tax=uncultured Dysosmobacter sp. TaxID=2591384 RepID=UPI00260D29F2|nr:TRAP transporter substrate-binding protein [uncultured Dysosmobacter sp.]
MKKVKKWLSLGLALILAAALTACGGKKTESNSPAETDPAESSAPIELTFPHVFSSTSNQAKWANWIADTVKERTDGGLIIRTYADSQLGDEPEVIPKIISGEFSMGMHEGSAWADAFGAQQLGVYGLPYLCTTYEGMKDIGMNILPDSFNQMLEDADCTDIIAFAPISQGIRGVFTASKPVRVAEDLVGQKIRTAPAALYLSAVEALGCTPTPIPLSEAYTSLTQGVVDGIENDPGTIMSMNMQEVLKYYTPTNHLASFNIICVNRSVFESLPEEYQTILRDTIIEGCSKQFDDCAAENAAYLEEMQKSGIEIIDFPDEELDKLRANAQPLLDEFAEEYDLGDLIAEMIAVED